MTGIGIGIPVFNDYILTSHLLDSIFFYTERNEINRIVVLDDGSDAEYREALRKVCAGRGVDLIVNDTNLGVPKSWNKLVNALGTENIILLNNDIIVWKGWFEAMKYALENNPTIGTVSLPTIVVNRCDVHKIIQHPFERHIEILKPWNKMVRPETRMLPETRDPIRVISPIGCSFGFSKRLFDKAMGFNESYYAFYEEVDFGVSLYGMRHPSIVLAGPHLYHVWGATFETNRQIDAQGIMNKSREKFIAKYGMDQIDLYRKLSHDFDTIFRYLDKDGNKKEVVLNYTWPPLQDCLIEW